VQQSAWLLWHTAAECSAANGLVSGHGVGNSGGSKGQACAWGVAVEIG